MRRLFRWAFRIVLGLIVLAVVAAVAAILLLDTLAKELIVNRLRAQTGMEVKVRAVHVGLLSPTFSVEGLKLYNTPAFGGSVCLDMPELHLEYDPHDLRGRRLHVTLLRLELAEVSIVLDKSGHSNFEKLKQKSKDSPGHKSSGEKLKFTGIDVLNFTPGKLRISNLASGRTEEIDFGAKNEILRDVKPDADLASLGLTMLASGKATAKGDAGLDLSHLFDSLLKTP
jgi:AsmA family